MARVLKIRNTPKSNVELDAIILIWKIKSLLAASLLDRKYNDAGLEVVPCGTLEKTDFVSSGYTILRRWHLLKKEKRNMRKTFYNVNECKTEVNIQ